MANIRDYANTEIKDKIEKKEDINTKKTEEDYSDLIELFLTKYGKMSEDELIQEMLKLIQKKKEEGSYDYQKILKLIKKVEPFLNNQQKNKMKDLLELI